LVGASFVSSLEDCLCENPHIFVVLPLLDTTRENRVKIMEFDTKEEFIG
jgi:hypothetical protein